MSFNEYEEKEKIENVADNYYFRKKMFEMMSEVFDFAEKRGLSMSKACQLLAESEESKWNKYCTDMAEFEAGEDL